MKSVQQTQDMIGLLKSELARLPATNVFGGSNAESIAEIKAWLPGLENYVSTGKPPVSDKRNTVSSWIHELGYSELQDFE